MENIIVLSDFDGTVTSEDVGYIFVKKYASPGWDHNLSLWKQGLIGSEECHKRIFPTIDVSKNVLMEEIDQVKLDPGFLDFYQYLKEQDIEIELVSDGFDFYIDPILKKYGLSNINYYANEMVYKDEKPRLELNFPGNHPFCKKCANCKAQVVKKYLDQGKRIIYIGDSYSDYYAASISDLIFAKKRLKEFCQQEQEEAVFYQTFQDILSYFKKGDLNFRYTEVESRECFMIERLKTKKE